VPETREHSVLRVANAKSAIVPGDAVLVPLKSPSVGKLVSFRLVGNPYLTRIMEGLLVTRPEPDSSGLQARHLVKLSRGIKSRYL